MVCLAMCAVRTGLAAGVVPDGGTKTTATVGANGRVTIGIAAPVDGVSNNTYRDFNVSRAGVDFDNHTAGARNIVNSVTSTNPSVLAGPLAVLGTRANVIISNPNGVSVNGLIVQNVGNLALTTGQVSPDSFAVTNGQVPRNIVLTTSQGAIEIGPEGLSGTLLNLELFAKQIRVGGPVTNLYGNPNAKVRLVAGSSRAEIDTSLSATDNLTRWITYSTPTVSPGQGIAIDITAAGSLSSGRIELMVTDQGAGVRHAGSAYATAGDFVVSGTGDLQLASGTVTAWQDVVIATAGLTGTGAVTAGQHLQVNADRVELSGSTLAAGTATTGDLVIGAPGQVHSAPVSLTDSKLTASGGIGLFDNGPGLILTGTQATARTGNLVINAPSLTMQGDGFQRAALTASQGVLSMTAPQGTSLTSSDLDGVGGTAITTGDLALQDASVKSSGGTVAMEASGAYIQRDSSVMAAGDVRLHAASVALDSVKSRSTFVATNGGVLIQSDTDFANTGGLIQGQARIAANPLSTGAVTIKAGGDVTNVSTPGQLGIVFGAADDVDVSAGGNLVNQYGRFLSNGYLRMAATGDVINTVTHTDGAGGGQLATYSSSGQRWLVLSRRATGLDVDYGQVDRPDQIAYLLSDKGTTLSGRNVINYGGDIYANNGPIRIDAADTFRNEGIATGSAHFERSCLIVCRTSASSTTSVTGGLLSAGGDIDIRAGKAAINTGGRVLAMGDLTVTAPVTYATGITGYTAISRDRGFKAFFGDTWARLYATDVGGSWMAAGKTQVNGDTVIDGGSFDGNVTVSGLTTVVRPRQRDPVSIEKHLGLTSWFWQ
jgi:filamentous hemagglutinin family protein